MKIMKTFVKNKLTIIAAVIITAAACYIFMHTSTPKITNSFINSKLESVSELTSAKLIYNGLYKYEDGNVPFLTKKAFSMTYRAEVKAGIDLSKVKISVTKSDVKITLPKTEILEVHIDPDSIQFYDNKLAILNWQNKEDSVTAIRSAEADVRKKADIEQLKNLSEENTETLIKELFSDCIGNRTLIIK